MEVTFLRHGPLLPPYDNYEKLTFDLLCQLARREVDPVLDISKAKKLIEHNELLKGNYDVIFHSPSARAVASTKLITESYKIQQSEELDDLQEILFDPSKFTTQEDFALNGLSVIRENLFYSLINGTNKESLSSCIKRITSIEKMLHASTYERCICITHGFFMRLLELYFTQNKDYKKYTYQSLVAMTNHSYLQGFVVAM